MAHHPAAGAGIPAKAQVGGEPVRLDTEFDAIVQSIYRAAAGYESWAEPLNRIAESSAASHVSITGFDQHTGVVTFRYEGGARPPEAASEYVRKFSRIDPTIALLRPLPPGEWVACQEHIDDAFVARDPFYQNYLLRYGSRYAYGAKLLEDDATMVVLAHHRPVGNPLIDPKERKALERLGAHVAAGLRLQKERSSMVERDALGYVLLDRLNQPVILLDRDRNITFCSEAARTILDRGDPVSDRNGVLVCSDAESDVALTMALRDLASLPTNSHMLGQTQDERRILRLRHAGSSRVVAATLFALRPRNAVPGAVKYAPRTLLVIHEVGPMNEIAPGFLSAAFNFTPAEARMAARLATGLSVAEIAIELQVSIATIRTQLSSAFDKTGTKRQADLVRLLLGVSAF
jgi:DNA-binding CsgD family transcriptional regulator/PAS domain-containing protein